MCFFIFFHKEKKISCDRHYGSLLRLLLAIVLQNTRDKPCHVRFPDTFAYCNNTKSNFGIKTQGYDDRY